MATLRDTGFEIIHARYTRTAEAIFQIHPEWRNATAVLGTAARRIFRTIAGEDLAVRLLGDASLMMLTRRPAPFQWPLRPEIIARNSKPEGHSI